VMAAYRPYGEFYDFYSVSPEYSGYFLVLWLHILLTNATTARAQISRRLTNRHHPNRTVFSSLYQRPPDTASHSPQVPESVSFNKFDWLQGGGVQGCDRRKLRFK
jgi:hypothetical protein